MNNADYGLSLQKMICEEYGIEINDWAAAQFEANYNKEYVNMILSTMKKRILSLSIY